MEGEGFSRAYADLRRRIVTLAGALDDMDNMIRWGIIGCGDVAEVKAPGGIKEYEILDVKYL